MLRPNFTVMGPALCQGCGSFVWWAHSLTRLHGEIVKGFLLWRDRGGAVHKCQKSAVRKRQKVRW